VDLAGGSGHLKKRDRKAQEAMAALAADEAIPATSLPTGFVKVVTILDEAVRGFRIAKAHLSFWSGKNRMTSYMPTCWAGPLWRSTTTARWCPTRPRPGRSSGSPT
jgi:hypothetical protein